MGFTVPCQLEELGCTDGSGLNISIAESSTMPVIDATPELFPIFQVMVSLRLAVVFPLSDKISELSEGLIPVIVILDRRLWDGHIC